MARSLFAALNNNSRRLAMRWTKNRNFLAAALALSLFAAACGPKSAAELPAACRGRSSASIGGPFTLINQDGKPMTEADFQGRPSLFYFGFTYCPDICPLTLTRLRTVTDQLGPDADKITTVFVTVDPARDTPEALKAYLSNPAFPKGIVGLTGSEDQVKNTLQAFKVGSQINKDPSDPSIYEVSHTSIIYLLGNNSSSTNKKWGLKAFFPDSTAPADIAACTKAALRGQL
jgi:protein SCO1